MNPESLQGRFLLVLVVLCLILGGFVISPFWVPLFLAIVFAVALHPLYMRFSRSLGNYRSIAALLTILVAIVGVLIPLAILLTLLSREAIGVYAAFHEGSAGAYLQEMLQSAQNLLNRYVPNAPDLLGTFAQNINSYAKTALGSLAGYLATAASVTASFLFSFFVFLMALFYLLKDGPALRKMIVDLSPLADSNDQLVFDRLKNAVNSVIKGNLTIALIQGIVASVGFLIFGVPNAILLGSVTALAAFVPTVGTSLVFVPVVLFMFFSSGYLPALGLLTWGVGAVALVDNILGPRLIGRGTQLHPLLALLSIIGGVALFGLVGIILGPLSMSLLLALLSIYSSVHKRQEI